MTSLCFADGIHDGIQQEQVAQQWADRGFSCELWVDPPEQVWEDYLHAEDELIMPITGQLAVEFKGQVHKLQPGNELLIPAQTLHSVRNIGNCTSCWLYGYRI